MWRSIGGLAKKRNAGIKKLFYMGEKHGAGKGDKYRKVDAEAWARGWDLAFSKKKRKKRIHSTNKRKRDAQ